MLGRMRRAEILAAVALIVGARQEPVAAMRQLAAADPSLRRLHTIADLCAAGTSLIDALVAKKIITTTAAKTLLGLPPDTMATTLKQIAHRVAWPSTGEVLARWLPVWALLAASVPSIIIGLVVALVAGSSYGGLWSSLGLALPNHGPAAWWLVQCGFFLLMLALLAGFWCLLRYVPIFGRLTIFSRRLERAAAASALLMRCRTGLSAEAAFNRWEKLSGDRAGVRHIRQSCGGDITTTLVRLGVVPCTTDGRIDWDRALRENEHVRTQAALAVSPWLVAILVFAGICGLVQWEYRPLTLGFSSLYYYSALPSQIDLIISHILTTLKIPVVALLAAHALLLFHWCIRVLVGPASDWPFVADRVAQAIEHRQSIELVLSGLRFVVDRPMRSRLNQALTNDEAHPGARLANAHIVPPTLATVIATADGHDLPTLLRSSAAQTPDHGLRESTSHATALVIMLIFLALTQTYLLIGVMPKFRNILQYLDQNFTAIQTLSNMAVFISFIFVAGIVLGCLVVAWGHRRGWWVAWHGWHRLARGLILRRQLALGAKESELARSIQPLMPQAGRKHLALTTAAKNGDLAGILAAADWPINSPEQLDHAIAADLIKRDRRRARFALGAQLVLPILVAIPMGLCSISVALTLSAMTRSQIATANGSPTGSTTLTGGSPGMAILYWWSQRCEAQGNAVVEKIRAEKFEEWKRTHVKSTTGGTTP